MAGAGYKLFNTGDVLTAAQVNTYLQEQTVMVFASSTARTTALSGVLAEGMVSYLQDTNAVEVYNGSAWVGVSGTGDVTEVQAGTGISVASGTGPIPVVTNTMATEITAAGDIIVGTGSATFDNLPIGTTGQVLTADTTVSPYKVKWAAAAGGGKLKQVISATSTTQTAFTTTSFADTTLSATITPSSASHKIIVLAWHNGTALTGGADKALVFKIVRAATDVLTTGNYLYTGNDIGSKHSPAFVMYIDSPNTTSSTTYKTQAKLENSGPTGYVQLSSAESQIILLEVEV